MKVERKRARLSLHRETVQSLGDAELLGAIGGVPTQRYSECFTVSVCCCPFIG